MDTQKPWHLFFIRSIKNAFMKTMIIAFFTLLGLGTAIAQTDTSRVPKMTPPKPVQSRFTTDYPNISPTWGAQGMNYTAQYTDQSSNQHRMVVYDRNGNVLSTDAEVDNTVYPVAISDYYTKNFPNEKYVVWSSQDGNGNINYYSKRKTEVLWFDKSGAYKSSKPIKKPGATKSQGK
jgi:hypothetical protein